MFLLAALSPLAFAILVVGCRHAGPSRLRPLLKLREAHNIFLSLYSAYAAFFVAGKLARSGRLGLLERGIWPLLCEGGTEVPPGWLESKFWEWFDTVLLFASGKTPGVLHVGHHATAASVTALNMNGAPTPIFDIGTLINAFVHALMYCYYWRPLLFRSMRRWITRLQILQHAVVLCSCVLALFREDCGAPVLPYAVALLAYAFYLAAFVHFYAVTYLVKTRKE